MSSLNIFNNRIFVPGFLINSMPKAGTNLLGKALSLFPGIRHRRAHIIGDGNVLQKAKAVILGNQRGRAHIGNTTSSLLGHQPNFEEDQVQIGIDWPQSVPISAIRNTILRLNKGSFVTGHIPFSVTMVDLLAETGLLSLLILRDPRDVVVSHANYVSSNPNHFLYAAYQKLSKSERIMQSIIGIKQETIESPKLLNIYERYQSILPWCSCDLNYTTYFERLVGPHGGGFLSNSD